LSIEVEVKQKMVRTAELEAEAEKARHVKQAEETRLRPAGARMAAPGQVLSFAAVGCHGRGWWTPAFALAGFGAARCLAASAVMFLLAAASARSQSFDIQDFAARIIASLPPDAAVRLACTGDDGRTQRELARALSGRGIRLADAADGTTIVRCGCVENLRERACIADIGDGSARRVVTSTSPRVAAEPPPREPIIALELRPLQAQRDQILDVAETNGGLLVLTPTALTLVPTRAHDGAPAAPASQPIATARVWPRDLRGRVRMMAGRFEVFLPGVTCRGSSTPFTLTCADEGEPWPIGIENAGIVPSRNTFATPEGLSFFDAAALGGQGWLVVDQQGVLTFLDAHRRVVARREAADHAVALKAPCASDAYVATTTRIADAQGDEVLRVSRVAGDQLAPLASTVAVPGVLTALWPATDDGAATAIVHNLRAGRYEAFHLSLSCTR